MAFTADYELLLDRLGEELQIAPRPARSLFARLIGSACTRIPVLDRSGRADRIDRLIEAEAWTDCALALIELELPAWKLRRLVCENGEWLCSLSQQPNLPVELDDTVDARHDTAVARAILRAFVEVRRRNCVVTPKTLAVPQVLPKPAGVICCDNFA